MSCDIVEIMKYIVGYKYKINSLMPVGRYINMDPLSHRVAYILDLVHLFWTIFFAESIISNRLQLSTIIAKFGNSVDIGYDG